MAVVSDLLAPSVVTAIVSRIWAPGSALQKMMGLEIGSERNERTSGRAYSWDIFDHPRTIAIGRAPGVGPAAIPVNPVGRVSGTFPRAYEKVIVPYELLANLRTIGKNAGERDKMGAAYLEQQARYVKTRMGNFREIMLAGLLTQGSWYMQFSANGGDDWFPVMTIGSNLGIQVNYQVPSGNLGNQNGAWSANLNPTGGGNIISAVWSNTATDIPSQLDQINQAFQNLVNAPLGVAITNSTVWRYLLKNTQIINQAGSANTPYAEYDYEEMRNEDGTRIGVFKGRLKAIPWLEWWIYDGGLETGGLPNFGSGSPTASYGAFYPATNPIVTFLAEPWRYYLKFMEGSEPVKDSPAAPAVERFGTHAWLREWDEPASVSLHCLTNCIPQLQIPKALMIGQVA